MLKHCRPDILARGHLSLLHRYGGRTCSSVGSFPEGRTVLGEGTEDLRAGGDIETPASEYGTGDSGNIERIILTMILTI